MSTRDHQASFAATFVDELVRHGVRHAFVSPGSRNTPLSVALVNDRRVEVHVVLDERSAAFAALGVARATGAPALVGCTSGTATANYHPAVIEAHEAALPMILATADRPARLRGTGANQTIDQTTLYGTALRAFHDATPATDARTLARAAVRAAVCSAPGNPAGPVQCNLQFDEPLVPSGTVEIAVPVPDDPVAAPEPAVIELPAARRPVVLAGWDADVGSLPAGVPVLADPLSALRAGPDAVSTYEALLRVPGFVADHRPDLVVRIGMPLTGKATHLWCDGSIPQVLVTSDTRPADPFGTAAPRVTPRAAVVTTTDVDPHWTAAWRTAEATARPVLDRTLDSFPTPFDGRVLRDLAAAVAPHTPFFVGSSMPVRDLEYFMAPRPDLRPVANRGASGIDGCVATVAGLALGAQRATVGILGDLTFLHDVNGLEVARRARVPVILVVLDNDGGGIFEFLPQRDALPHSFEQLFGTPHGLDLVTVARAHGVAATRVDHAEQVVQAVAEAATRPETTVIVVPSDRTENRQRHEQVWAAVAGAFG